MRIYASGQSREKRFRQSIGNLDVLTAEDGGQIRHRGSVREAHAQFSGKIVVLGEVTEYITATSDGIVFAHGNPETVVAKSGGTVCLAGSPKTLLTSHNGSAYIFGEPMNIISENQGNYYIFSLNPDYEPDHVSLSDHGSFGIYKMGESGICSPAFDEMLDVLFPKGEADPLFVAYKSLLAVY